MSSGKRQNPFLNRQPLQPGGREVFMRRLRESLGHPPGQSPAPAIAPPYDERPVRQIATDDPDLVQKWIARAQGNSISVARVQNDPAEIRQVIEATLIKHQIKSALINAHEWDQRLDLAVWLHEKGLQSLEWGTPNCMDLTLNCEAAITDCRAALADTGSVLVWSDAGFGRSSTLVVPVHIIILPASRILPDLVDGLTLVMRENGLANGMGLPSNVVIINGPSKTGDIEMELITGVHGPKHVSVVVVG